MMQTHTVTATAVTTTTDDLGNSTTATTTTTATGVTFAPEGLQESVTGTSPTLIGDATLYGQLPALNSDDTITHASTCCDGADFALATWQVVGGSKGWGRGDKALPIKRTAAV